MSDSVDAPGALSPEDRDEMLGVGGIGVLAFARGYDVPPYAVPVSYGYDAETTTFYFRLAVDSDSEKAPLDDRPVTFVVHAQNDVWQSVVAQGRLEPTDDDDVGTDVLAGLRRTHIPLVDIFGQEPRHVPFEFYRLSPMRMTARTETSP